MDPVEDIAGFTIGDGTKDANNKQSSEDLLTISVKNLHIATGWLYGPATIHEGWQKTSHVNMGGLFSNEANSSNNSPDDSSNTAVEDEIKERWEREQMELKKQLLLHDIGDWILPSDKLNEQKLHHIGGVDISFIIGDNVNACAALVVLSYPDLEVVYEDLRMIQLTAPYIPGFLAFREAPALAEMVHDLEVTAPALVPQVILVDGNGILHPRGFGLASHLGVLIGIPCIGVAKNLFHVDGLERDDQFKEKVNAMNKAGDSFKLEGSSGKCLGMALRTSDSAPKPVFISQGHGISLATAVKVSMACSRYRIPEPTRQADLRSRDYLRQKSSSDQSSQQQSE